MVKKMQLQQATAAAAMVPDENGRKKLEDSNFYKGSSMLIGPAFGPTKNLGYLKVASL